MVLLPGRAQVHRLTKEEHDEPGLLGPVVLAGLPVLQVRTQGKVLLPAVRPRVQGAGRLVTALPVLPGADAEHEPPLASRQAGQAVPGRQSVRTPAGVSQRWGTAAA